MAYSGNVGDSMAEHNGMKLTTKNNDNDPRRGENCAGSTKVAFYGTIYAFRSMSMGCILPLAQTHMTFYGIYCMYGTVIYYTAFKISYL